MKSDMFNLAKKNFCYYTKIIIVLQQWYQQVSTLVLTLENLTVRT